MDFDRSVIIVVRNLTRFGEGSPENIPQRARSLRCSPRYAPLLACGRRESVSAADWFSAIVTAVRSAQGSARFRLLRHARLPSRATPSIPQRVLKPLSTNCKDPFPFGRARVYANSTWAASTICGIPLSPKRAARRTPARSANSPRTPSQKARMEAAAAGNGIQIENLGWDGVWCWSQEFWCGL